MPAGRSDVAQPSATLPLLPQGQRPSIDLLASLGNEEALRRQSDTRNFAVLLWAHRVLLLLAAIGLLVAAVGKRFDLFGVAVAAFQLLFAAVVLLVLRRIDPGRGGPTGSAPNGLLDPIARRVVLSFRAATLLVVATQAVLVVVYAAHVGSATPWLVMLPFFVTLLCLLPAETLLLHGLLAALVFAARLVPGPPPEATPPNTAARHRSNPAIPALVTNAIALALGLAVNRRFRRRFLASWAALRESARDQIRMRDELEFARRVQLSMLPNPSPSFDWIDLAGRSVPATEVGGDYYDYFRIDAERVAIVSADVAGHGLASGLVLSGLRSCLALLAEELVEPGAVTRKLDRMVRQTTSHRMLVTLAILLLDRSRGSATVTSAGHPPILRRSAQPGSVETIAFSSLPLGARLAGDYEERRLSLSSGDVFLLYTDGVYEAVGKADEPYGLDRLSRLFGSLPAGLSPEKICDAIVADLVAFTGRTAFEDDVTLVAVRVR
jgi:serine phosphatase RsbU (regulator of sigma subunit)